ncbi:MAG TPA: portal protein [Cyclobacteriaceae bacterium]
MAEDDPITTPTIPDDPETFLGLALERFEMAEQAERQIREKSIIDLKFRAGEQWPENIQNSRTVDQRPCLTINRIPQFVRQVTNDARHNRPSVKVSPVDDGGDEDIAKIINGMFRHIEVSSNADIAYDTAVDSQVTIGFGYFRVITKYTDDDSFEQDLVIQRIKNPFTVYFDPGCIEPDYSDANWAFIVDEMTKENYKSAYPDSAMASLEDFQSVGDHAPGWADGNSVRIAEYFVREHDEKWLYQLEDGTVTDKLPKGEKPKNKRRVRVPKITWYKINAIEILEKQEWAGRWIPIIPVLGDDLDIDGKRELIGLVRFAQDPQRMLNYWVTAQTEAIALAPKAPWLLAAGQMKGFEAIWQTANIKTSSHLPYNPISIDGIQVPPPQRMTAEPPVQAMSQASIAASQYLKDVTGIYDASLGQAGAETSGKAILARQSQSNISNFHFLDNLSRSIKHLGRILLDLLPKIYDTERVVRIIGADGSASTAKINSPVKDPITGAIIKIENDITIGKYDVVVDVGPSYSTKRKENADAMIQISQAYPALWQLAGDLMVGELDWPGADALAERLKMALPPNIQQAIAQEEQGQEPLPPQVQAKMQQAMQMVQQLTQALNAAHQKLESKQIENQAKLQVAAMDNQTKIATAQIQAHSQANLATLQAELDHFAGVMDNYMGQQNMQQQAQLQNQNQQSQNQNQPSAN